MTHADRILKTVDQWLKPLGYTLDHRPKPKHLFNRVREFYVYPPDLNPDIFKDKLRLSSISPEDAIKSHPNVSRSRIPKTKLRIRIENPSFTKSCPFDEYTFYIYLP